MSGEPIIYANEGAFLPDALRWAWAIGAPYNVYHNFPVDLPVAPLLAQGRYKAQCDIALRYLAGDWEIGDRESLVAQMIDLGQDGHRRSFRQIVRHFSTLPSGAWAENEKTHREGVDSGHSAAFGTLFRMWSVHTDILGCRTASFLGFDAARAAQLTRCGYALGWITEDEMRGYMLDLAREVSTTFDSWDDFARDFMLGRAFWAGQREVEPWEPILALLHDDPRSPWRRLPFPFPEDEQSRHVTSADTRNGPFWTLETAGLPPERRVPLDATSC